MQKNSPEQTLQHYFEAPIWKIEIEEESGLIAIESRDAATHTASFSLFNFRTGECLFANIQVENSWWHGLDKVHAGTVFLHGYESENSPQHKGIIAISNTGEIKWQQFNLAIEGVTTAGLLVYYTSLQPRKLMLADPLTGQIQNQPVTNIPISYQHIRLPGILSSGTAVPTHLPENIEGPLLCLDYKELTCWSFHTKKNGGISQHLQIHRNDVIVLHDFLSQDIQKLNPEAFFLLSGYLFYVRNKVEIVSYLL